ncbi:Outer membrane scaffolding protein for murein synthesis, MipA/OmpV family [Cupriavidus sp. YR651]|uniref:MipA/OmpV family protein n=1 Tax=Cupriavidus sp. YR651 TaxID=1855315 RepID=UPI00088B3F44|nr:MipA/OmpV family protein [Cupriavidus sp. YR651]SDD52663.1 Outer membrane scaffolding protein for murein synthesis, MipA/OmpV family [Cupriavidus sp. YR651]
MRTLALLLIPVASSTFAATFARTTTDDAQSGGSSVSIGLAGGVAPRYLGSKDYRPVIAPLLSAQAENGLFASFPDGLGYRFSSSTGIFGSAALAYALGREDHNRADLPGSDHLAGMGKIRGSVVNRLMLGYAVTDRLSVSGTVDIPLTHRERGVMGNATVRYIAYQGPLDEIVVSGGLLLGNGRYNQSYFGVDAGQSARSGFQEYGMRGGPFAADVGLAWRHRFDRHWSLMNSLTVSTLIGNAAQSPIVERRTSVLALTAVRYTF